MVSFHRCGCRRRAMATMDWAKPKIVKPATMKRVPDHVNSGSSEISRIQARAAMPSAHPPTKPAASVDAVRRGERAVEPSGAPARSVIMAISFEVDVFLCSHRRP
ncbi:MAG TPA: hypothetical protein PLS72_16940, partial [Ilumatobacteraceae bacterium]|nr:hypothetical protein [Ilumatobacteraceae bacterium]